MDKSAGKVTHILDAVGAGDAQAAEQLLPLVYDELRRVAAAKLANEPPGQTLQPTALVHEAWLRLIRVEDAHFQNRAHFFAAAAEAMRRILTLPAAQGQLSEMLSDAGRKLVFDFHQLEPSAPGVLPDSTSPVTL